MSTKMPNSSLLFNVEVVAERLERVKGYYFDEAVLVPFLRAVCNDVHLKTHKKPRFTGNPAP